HRIALTADDAKLKAGQQLTVGVRPQHLALSRDPASPRMTVRLVEALGSETVIHGDIHGERLLAVLPGQQVYRAGDEVPLDFAEAPLHLFDEQDLRLLSTRPITQSGAAA